MAPVKLNFFLFDYAIDSRGISPQLMLHKLSPTYRDFIVTARMSMVIRFQDFSFSPEKLRQAWDS